MENRKRRNESQIQKEEAFKLILDSLCDIAMQSALADMEKSNSHKVQEDRLFLMAQREQNRLHW